eukprot:scaffold9274_cov103-Isochrysis_galbana.AAC.3
MDVRDAILVWRGPAQAHLRHEQITLDGVAQLLLDGDHVVEGGVGDGRGGALLAEVRAEDGARLLRWWLKRSIRLQHNVLAALLGLENLERFRLETRRDDPVGYLDLEQRGGRRVNGRRDGHKVAERAERVRLPRAQVGDGCVGQLLSGSFVHLEHVRRERRVDGGAGGRDMLERGGGGQAGRLAQLADELPRVEGVQKVDVAGRAGEHCERERLWALRREEASDRGGLLVRIAPVLERLHGRAALAELALHPLGNGGVVRGGMRKRLECVHGLGLGVGPCRQAGEVAGVVGRLDENRDARVILGRGAHHRRAADVDILNADIERRALGDSRRKRVQVDDNQVDGLAAQQLGELLPIGFGVAHEDAAVHARVKRLHTAIHDFGRLRVLGDVRAWHPSVADRLGRAASGEDGKPVRVQPLDEIA